MLPALAVQGAHRSSAGAVARYHRWVGQHRRVRSDMTYAIVALLAALALTQLVEDLNQPL